MNEVSISWNSKEQVVSLLKVVLVKGGEVRAIRMISRIHYTFLWVYGLCMSALPIGRSVMVLGFL